MSRDEEVRAALAEAGLPSEASVAGLIRHHRSNAALAAGFAMLTIEAAIRKHADAIDGYDGSLSAHGECFVCDVLFRES